MTESIASKINEWVKEIECHLGRIILNNLKEWKDDIHQIELVSDEVNTHEEVRMKTIRVAEGLKERGFGLGDQIIICGETHNEICLPVIAALYIGCSVFPLSPTLTVGEMKRMLSLGNPKIVFCDYGVIETFKKALNELHIDIEIVGFGDVPPVANVTPFSEFVKPTGTEDSFEVTDLDPSTTIATISCSSGTTGLPKGVCHTHDSLALPISLLGKLQIAIGQNLNKSLYMNFSNYYWISGIYSLLMTCTGNIPRLNCAAPYTEDLLEKGLNNYKPNLVFLSPVAVHNLCKSKKLENLDFSCVKSFFVGGASTHEYAVNAIQKKLTNGILSSGFGCTEVVNFSSNRGNTNSVGRPVPWLQYKLVDVSTRKEVKVGEQGELCVKGIGLFKCYLNDPEATRDAYDEEGFFKTGDILTVDDKGFLYFIDRLKGVIKFRNFQITPAEVEMEILKHPDVMQVCVVGRKHEGDGELPVAFVQKKVDSKITEQNVRDIVENSLADHKQLRGGVVFIEKLPETVSGKINRAAIRTMANSPH